MTTTDVENLNYADLKKRHDELVSAMKDQPVDELARRYVQARTDAKGRDEKMVEQGKTITELQLALDASRTTSQVALEAAKLHIEKIEAECSTLSTDVQALIKGKAGMEELLKVEVSRSGRLQIQAEKHAAAISAIHKTSLDAINSQVITEAGK